LGHARSLTGRNEKTRLIRRSRKMRHSKRILMAGKIFLSKKTFGAFFKNFPIGDTIGHYGQRRYPSPFLPKGGI
jgi:hypothetical protein